MIIQYFSLKILFLYQAIIVQSQWDYGISYHDPYCQPLPFYTEHSRNMYPQNVYQGCEYQAQPVSQYDQSPPYPITMTPYNYDFSYPYYGYSDLVNLYGFPGYYSPDNVLPSPPIIIENPSGSQPIVIVIDSNNDDDDGNTFGGLLDILAIASTMKDLKGNDDNVDVPKFYPYPIPVPYDFYNDYIDKSKYPKDSRSSGKNQQFYNGDNDDNFTNNCSCKRCNRHRDSKCKNVSDQESRNSQSSIKDQEARRKNGCIKQCNECPSEYCKGDNQSSSRRSDSNYNPNCDIKNCKINCNGNRKCNCSCRNTNKCNCSRSCNPNTVSNCRSHTTRSDSNSNSNVSNKSCKVNCASNYSCKKTNARDCNQCCNSSLEYNSGCNCRNFNC